MSAKEGQELSFPVFAFLAGKDRCPKMPAPPGEGFKYRGNGMAQNEQSEEKSTEADSGTHTLFQKLLQLAAEEPSGGQDFVEYCWDSLWLGDDEMEALMDNPTCRELLEKDIPILMFHWMSLTEGGGINDKALGPSRGNFNEDEIQEIKCRLGGIAGFFQVRELFPAENQVLVEDIVTSETHLLFDRTLSNSDALESVSAGLIVNHPDGTRSAFHPYSLITIPLHLKERVWEMIKREFEEENEAIHEEDGADGYETFSDYLKANLQIVAHVTQWVLHETLEGGHEADLGG